MPRLPVIFVPGFSGSFNLMALLDLRRPGINGWGFPPFVDYGKTFLEGFRLAGYKRDQDLFVAFYDWRRSVKDTAREYLIPWIDRARKRAKSEKVILVGHSMGGLVARSYIQSSSYRHDVERLITLGTPHRGSAEAYYPWGGGDLRSDPTVKAVFDVYLWFLRHFHPAQTELNRLQTIRTQIPGVRDLLPIDDYLFDQDIPLQPKPEERMAIRNTWSELLNNQQNIETLFDRVQVTTFSGSGFSTVQSIIVAAPPPQTGRQPRFPDGEPVGNQADGNGDGTVALRSAQLANPRANNHPPALVRHDQLADLMVSQVLAELGEPAPALPPTPATEPRLVILTASPIELIVEMPTEPAPPPGVLGAAEAAPRPRRARRVRGQNHGHSGKHLNIAVIPQPATGTYTIRLQGTATGSFALGAMIIGTEDEGTVVLGAGAEATTAPARPAPSDIATTYGQVAAGTELYYQVVCPSLYTTPEVRFNAEATAANALTRMRESVQAPLPGVLGAAGDPGAQVRGVLGATAAAETLRERVDAAMMSDDATATAEVTALLGSAQEQNDLMALLHNINAQIVNLHDSELAAALDEQLKQIAAQ